MDSAPRQCPHCHAPHVLDGLGECARCRGSWIRGEAIDALARGRLPFLRRFIARGPPTPRNCPSCRTALKAFDVPGFQHEGDLFWGHETPRPIGTCVAEGCSTCGGAWLDEENLARGGGLHPVKSSLGRLADELA